MSTTTKTLTAGAAISLLLLLAACSSPEPSPTNTPTAPAIEPAESDPAEPAAEPEIEPEKTALGEGDYAFALGMTIGKFTLPGESDAELLELIKKVDDEDEDPVTFVTVRVDNREGQDEARVSQIRGYDAAGTEYMFLPAIDIVEFLREELTDSEMDYDQYLELFEKHAGGASPGAVTDFLMISGDELPEEFARITVNAGPLIGEVDAVTAAEAEAQQIPLDF